jgi:hypothetical protein
MSWLFPTEEERRLKRERERFYLLPGMGGRAYFRKQKTILRWSIAAGLLVSAVLGVLLYLLSLRW